MILNYEHIKHQIKTTNESIVDSAFIQKIFSSAYYIALSIRVPGKTIFVYIGRGGGNEGVWLGEKNVESFLRRKDKLLEYLRRNLANSKFMNLDLDPKDRIISLNYEKWRRENSILFFYNARNLYFAHIYYDPKYENFYVFKSWNNTRTLFEGDKFSIFDEVGRTDLKNKHSDIPIKIEPVSSLIKKEKRLALVSAVGGKSPKFYKRKIKNIKGDLLKVESWKNLEEMVLSEQDFSKFPMKNILFGIKINFKYKDHYKRRDEIYTKIKKLKKAQKILGLRLTDTEESIKKLPSEETLKSNLKVISPVWSTANKKVVSIEQPKEKAYKILKFGKFDVGIGVSSQGNDQLRKDWGKKEDIWFHLEGDKSPHLILKLKNTVMDQNVLSIVASVMIEFSKLDYREAQLIYTAVKNLKGIKGAPGKVNYKKEKHISIMVNDNWRDLLTSD